MKHQYTFLLTLLLTFLCTSVRAQTTIAVMDFDGTTPEMGVATDVPFFQSGASGFFGIHNANGDDTDGTPADTDAANATRIALITSAGIQGDFLFVNDLDDSDGGNMNGTPDRANVTFGPVTIPGGASGLLFSFNYDVANFNGGDEVFYTLVLDGVAQPEVHFIGASGGPQTGAGTIEVVIPDGTGTTSLILGIESNGDQSAGFDNFIVTSGNTGLPCGVTSFGPGATETCVANTNGVDDPYTLSIDYTGIDASGTLALLVNGSAASTFTNSGDDPATTGGGTIEISSPDLIEGTSYEVTFTNPGSTCAFSVSGSVATNTCVSVCDLSADISMLRLGCVTFTPGGSDQVFGTLDYNGVEPGATATITGGPGFPTIISGDPGTEEDGEIAFVGLIEGGTYTITISGGACTGMDAIVVPFTVPVALCAPSDLVINEVLANPTGGIDVNQDGSLNSDDEFVELYNSGTSSIDISGFTLEEFAGIRHTFAEGTVLQAGEGILVIAEIPAGGLTTPYGCYVVDADNPFIGLNNTGTDGVAIRDAAGNIVAQMTFTDAPTGESLALNPDGNLAGGYLNHSTVSATGALSSPCSENVDNNVGLPVELLTFTAQPAGKKIVLEWMTANEVANDRFEVERRTRTGWEVLGAVSSGAAASNTYTFADTSPVNGENYYRLRQVDLDGSATLYGPVMAAFTSTELLLFPNPATTELRFGGAFSPADRISLLDANGRVLRQLPAGSNRADVAELAPGIYLVRVARAGGTEVLRFVKR